MNDTNVIPATNEEQISDAELDELRAFGDWSKWPGVKRVVARIDADAKALAELREQADTDARYIASYRVDLEEARREIAERDAVLGPIMEPFCERYAAEHWPSRWDDSGVLRWVYCPRRELVEHVVTPEYTTWRTAREER